MEKEGSIGGAHIRFEEQEEKTEKKGDEEEVEIAWMKIGSLQQPARETLGLLPAEAKLSKWPGDITCIFYIIRKKVRY